MSDKAEKVSALVDNELEDTEFPAIAQELMNEKQLVQRWERYHLISDALRNNLLDMPVHRLADRVGIALKSEPTMFPTRGRVVKNRLFTKQIVSWAAATSIAGLGIFIFVAQTALQDRKLGGDSIAKLVTEEASEKAPSVTRVNRPDFESEWISLHPELDKYLLSHSESASAGDRYSLLPYVRIIGYSSDK